MVTISACTTATHAPLQLLIAPTMLHLKPSDKPPIAAAAYSPRYSHADDAVNVGLLRITKKGKCVGLNDVASGAKIDGDGGDKGARVVSMTLGSLPDEVLAVVFGYCDARTRMMAIPAVSTRWLGVCMHHMRNVAIDLAWAARDYSCAITDTGLAGLVLRFPCAATANLACCENFTDAGLKAVASGCPHLQHLDLGYCKGATDAGLKAVAARCPHLQRLSITCCVEVTGAGLRAIAASCPKLQHFNLGYCANVEDAGLRAVAAGCPNLRSLNLSCCPNVTDAGLRAVAAGCPNLQHLSLGNCVEVTDAGLRAVAAACPNLGHLFLAGCKKVTDAGAGLFPATQVSR